MKLTMLTSRRELSLAIKELHAVLVKILPFYREISCGPSKLLVLSPYPRAAPMTLKRSRYSCVYRAARKAGAGKAS